jgi:glycosyltransferase involved in cell wall biosynthesis
MYKEKDGIDVTPIGPFIDPTFVVAERRDPKHVLLVNPSLAKGAAIVIRLAMMLEGERPDITFEVVQSRGNWEALVKQVTKQFGEERSELSNVILTPNTPDMRPIYARAKVLLALSLWWESFGRVAAEAAMNGIPVVHSNRGGLPEASTSASLPVNLPPECHVAPYTKLPQESVNRQYASQIIELCDNDYTSHERSNNIKRAATNFAIESSTYRLIESITQI